MTLARLDDTQLADIRSTYESLLSDPNADEGERLVAAARLKELDAELARRGNHTDGHNGNGKAHNRWAFVDLVQLIRESGCQLHEKGESKYVGDHSVKHASKSGACMVVWTDQGFWYCTSCKENGDAAAWVAHVEGIERKEAARKLRERFGDPSEDEEGQRPPSQATVLVRLARESAELFHMPAEGEGYATAKVSNHRETWALGTKAFRYWLGALYYARHEKAPGASAVQDAIDVLRGHALFSGPEHQVFVRLAEQNNCIYLDLGNDAWEAVEITPAGWRVIADPPVRFRRARGMLALPRPIGGGKVEELRPFVNAGDENDWKLIVGWLLAALRPRGPYPVLPLHGEQGSGKSTRSRVLKALVDPSTAPLRSEPKDARDLMIAASNGWLVAYDNLSYLASWLSDAICRLATGGGFGTRELYSNGEEVLFDAMRPVLLTGIEDLATRSDLLDRSIILYLPQIPDEQRRTEGDFWREFEDKRPRILGALLDAVSVALGNVGRVRLSAFPRMADFAQWVTAAEAALGWEPGSFLEAYAGNREVGNDLSLEASPVAAAVLEFARGLDDEWRGTATELLKGLAEFVDEKTIKERGWPKRGNSLSGALRRLAPNLRVAGVDVQLDLTRGRGLEKRRAIALKKREGKDRPHRPIVPIFTDPRSDSIKRGDDPRMPGDDPRLFGDDPMAVGDDAGTMFTLGDDGDDIFLTGSEGRVSQNVGDDYTLLTTTEAIRGILPDLILAPVIGLDLETSGLDPHHDHIRLVQISTSKRAYIVDASHVDLGVLRPILENQGVKVLHNAKFDLQFLLAKGLTVSNVFDTLLADQVLRGSRYPRKLSELATEYLGIELDKSLQTSDWPGSLSQSQLAYAAKDAAVLLPLYEKLDAAIKLAKLERCLRVENRAVPAIAWLEYSGAPFDTEAWRKLADATLLEKLKVEQQLTAMAEEALGANTLFGREVNWDAPAQVLEVLRALGLDVGSTNEDALAGLSDKHPIIAKILLQRELAKRTGTYGLNVLGDVHTATGRIHAGWRQIGADSGRMACTGPNLQNIPRTPAYRACFKAPAGRVLVKADYSQIELRIAAEVSGDKRMLQAYLNGEDLHVLTAQAILGNQNVTKEDRQIAKSANFGLLYGMGVDGFRQYAQTNYGVALSTEQATTLRNKFFETYPGLRAWHRMQPGKDRAIDTRTLAGRRRVGVQKFTEKLNTPVQGTGADGLKASLALLWETRKQCLSAVPVLAVHDEIVIECDIEEADKARDWLVDCMQRGMKSFLRQVPVEVEPQIIAEWSGRAVEGQSL